MKQYAVPFLPEKNLNYPTLEKYIKLSIKEKRHANYGPCVRLLEKVITDIIKIDTSKLSVIAVCNGTAALFLISKLYGKLYTTSYNFRSVSLLPSGIITNSCVSEVRVKPSTKEKLFYKLQLIPFGMFSDSYRYDNVLYDAAASPLTFRNNINVINFAKASAISLHHTKPLGYGEGGILIIEKKYEEQARNLINFNIPNNECDGFNFKMSDIAAAAILAYLESLNIEHMTKSCVEKFEYVQESLKQFDIQFFENDSEKYLLSCLPVIFNKPQVLNNEHIECNKYYKPIDSNNITDNNIYNKIICYPFHHQMTYNHIDLIIEDIKQRGKQ